VTGRASRDRGARAERAVVTYLRSRGFDQARRHHGADGRAPGDIMGVPGICIEVKDRASSAWPTWREQLLTECPPGDIAVLVRRVRGVGDVGRWDAEIPERDWWWLVYLVGTAPPVVKDCPRTGERWVRTTVTEIVDLLTDKDNQP
jgi:hypothetical protein